MQKIGPSPTFQWMARHHRGNAKALHDSKMASFAVLNLV
jgi:hypothetical protein